MTKSEKNAIADAIAMLNAIVAEPNGQHNEAGQESNDTEGPDEKELQFFKRLKNVGSFSIEGTVRYPEKRSIGYVYFGEDVTNRLITAYLEKYGQLYKHES